MSREELERLWAEPWNWGWVYLQHGDTLVKIGREAELHYATVSRIIKAMEEMSSHTM